MPGMHMWQIPGSQWMWTDFYVSCDAHLLWPLCRYIQWVLMGLICPAWDRRWSKYSVQQISCGFIFGPLTKIPNAKHCKRVWKIISLHIFAHEFAAWFYIQARGSKLFGQTKSLGKSKKVPATTSTCVPHSRTDQLRQACLRTPIRKVWLRRISGSKNMAIVYPQVFSGILRIGCWIRRNWGCGTGYLSQVHSVCKATFWLPSWHSASIPVFCRSTV